MFTQESVFSTPRRGFDDDVLHFWHLAGRESVDRIINGSRLLHPLYIVENGATVRCRPSLAIWAGEVDFQNKRAGGAATQRARTPLNLSQGRYLHALVMVSLGISRHAPALAQLTG